MDIMDDVVVLAVCKHATNELMATEDICFKTELNIKDLGEIWRGKQEKLAERFHDEAVERGVPKKALDAYLRQFGQRVQSMV
jgi:hypothetical protein